MEDDKKVREAAKLILSQPYGFEFSDSAERVRRNLLLGSSIAILFAFAGDSLSPKSSFLGFRFEEDVFAPLMKYALLAFLAYQIVHFGWHCLDAFRHYRIRLTGSRAVASGDKFYTRDQSFDEPDEPNQTSLYTWWTQVEQHLHSAASLESILQEIKSINPRTLKAEGNKQVIDRVDALYKKYKSIEKIILDKRIKASLYNFDKWYRHMTRSEIFRWLIMEIGFPIALGLLALAMLWLSPSDFLISLIK